MSCPENMEVWKERQNFGKMTFAADLHLYEIFSDVFIMVCKDVFLGIGSVVLMIFMKFGYRGNACPSTKISFSNPPHHST